MKRSVGGAKPDAAIWHFKHSVMIAFHAGYALATTIKMNGRLVVLKADLVNAKTCPGPYIAVVIFYDVVNEIRFQPVAFIKDRRLSCFKIVGYDAIVTCAYP